MKDLEMFLRPTQKRLYAMLRKMFKGNTICRKGGFILVRGEAPVILVAHLDTVHKEPVQEICRSDGGVILMSPQGIGGDDRCGVYALVSAYETAAKKPWLLFTCDEEIGGHGAEDFCEAYEKGRLPKEVDSLKLLVEIDRRGSKDAVYYDCDNAELEAYITSKGFVTAGGSFSDISYIAPELGVAAVNLSSGYYNAHTLHEYINRKHLDAVIVKVNEIVAEAAQADFPKYEYRERVRVLRRDPDWISAYGWGYGVSDNINTVSRKTPIKPIPTELIDTYDVLLDFYTEDELENYREAFGDEVLKEIWENEIGPDYGGYDDTDEEDGLK